jgi:hypothetical protein
VAESNKSDKRLQPQVADLWDLIVRYAKQETVDPLKSLFRFLAWGVIGSVFVAIGGVLIALAVVRVIQEEAAPHLSGNWSWVPYGGAVLFALLLIGLLARLITSDKRRVDRERAALRSGKG